MRIVKQINFHASFLPWFPLSIFYHSSRRRRSHGSRGRPDPRLRSGVCVCACVWGRAGEQEAVPVRLREQLSLLLGQDNRTQQQDGKGGQGDGRELGGHGECPVSFLSSQAEVRPSLESVRAPPSLCHTNGLTQMMEGGETPEGMPRGRYGRDQRTKRKQQAVMGWTDSGKGELVE